MAQIPHILHVDDNEDDRLLFEFAFQKSGIKGVLHGVSSAAEVMLYLNCIGPYHNAPRPRLIVIDLDLPKVDGLVLLEALKSNIKFKSIPVVILSGSQSYLDKQRCRDLGVDDYVVKPATSQELAELIASLDHWLVGSSTGVPTPPK